MKKKKTLYQEKKKIKNKIRFHCRSAVYRKIIIARQTFAGEGRGEDQLKNKKKSVRVRVVDAGPR